MDLNRLVSKLREQDFGPGESVIASTIMNPKLAAQKGAEWFAGQMAKATNTPDPYDNPTPLRGYSPEQQVEGAFNLAGLAQTGALPMAPSGAGTVGSIKAFHGSPHKFEQFDMSKIGTGEGAQAYGHGLYFAESPSVAHMYADALGSKNQDVVNNAIKNIVSLHNADTSKIRNELLSQGLPEERISPELESSIAKIVKATDPSDGSVHPSALREYEALQQLVPNEKHFYETSLEWPDPAREAADPLGPEHFFQFDNPLDELSQKDAKIINPLIEKLKAQPNPSLFENVKTGGDVIKYASVVGLNPEKELANAGYPGIRYLDQGSRGAGEGTHNYVVFDDRIPKIVEINGKPVDVSNLANKLRGE